jgi:TonB family protein
MFFRLGASILASIFASSAQAQNGAPAPAPQTVAPSAATAGHSAEAAAPVLSESKFLSVLYAEIARVGGADETSLGEGSVTASFHVGASGAIDKVTIDKATTPAMGEAVKKMLAKVKVPPPPGGGMDVGQTFKFH